MAKFYIWRHSEKSRNDSKWETNNNEVVQIFKKNRISNLYVSCGVSPFENCIPNLAQSWINFL